jgi:serine/threonine protein phosphatase PrpC
MNDKIRKSIHASKLSLNDLGIDAWFNGTTLNFVLFSNDILYCANVGDSRAVLYNKEEVIQLSRDHKPDLEDEKRWVLEKGGKVYASNGGPLRVWGEPSSPGLAMTWSIGDFVTSWFGVISDPEIYERQLM